MNAHWSRRLSIVVAIMFFASLIFAVVAGLSHNTTSFPSWWGPLDVGLSFVLATLVISLMAATKGKVGRRVEEMTYRSYRILIHVTFAMLLLFFLAGNRIIWINCLTGFSWRFWLLMYSLPNWIAALDIQEAKSNSNALAKPSSSDS